MKNIVPVRFKTAGKAYYFDPHSFDLHAGDKVIVETSRGIELGTVASGIREIDENEFHSELKSVVRLAAEEDIAHYEDNKRREKEAFGICLEKIKAHKLEMKLVEVEYTFDGSKILFYFTAEGRVDFRELVKDLATVFHTRIELRQIGVRDESKTLGSIGVCGRSLCCSQWLGEFVPVSIKMAKEQGLSLNPTKISGACGRLMCCLNYEQDVYEELVREMPKLEQKIKTPDGIGTVVSVSLLRGTVKAAIENDAEKTLNEYNVNDITIIKQPKANRSKAEAKEEINKEIDQIF